MNCDEKTSLYFLDYGPKYSRDTQEAKRKHVYNMHLVTDPKSFNKLYMQIHLGGGGGGSCVKS